MRRACSLRWQGVLVVLCCASSQQTHLLFLTAGGHNAGAEMERRGLTALPSDDDVMYLDGLQVHLAGCGHEETLELTRICRDGAATRHAKLCSTVTHIVVSQVPLSISGAAMCVTVHHECL